MINKYFNFFSEILKGRITSKRIPISVVLCLTNRCNLRCLYCYEEYYDRNGHHEFTTGQIFSLIDELARMGTKFISINGGEVLLRNDIGAIIDKIKEKNIFCQLITNGLLLKKKADVLKNVDSLCLSLDGKGAENDSNRGQGTYDKIIDLIEYLRENGIKFHTNTVFTKNNRNAVDDIMGLADKYNFKARFSILRGEDSPNKDICLNDEEVKQTISKLINYKKNGFPAFYSYSTFKNVLDWPFSFDTQIISGAMPAGYKPIPCYLRQFSCHIEANGLVYPCVVLVNKFKAVNFLESGFKKAWENLEDNDCKACYNICCNDLNLLCGLRLEPVWNAFKLAMDMLLHQVKGRLTGPIYNQQNKKG